jgi:hypothetical protein
VGVRPYEMTEDEENRVLDELLDVLDEVVKTSGCRDMVPLWLLATRAARASHFRSSDAPAFHVPSHILAWLKPMRSKYAALAGWRHAVLMERILDALDPKVAPAVTAMYFTACPENAPPYSWSRASARHPDANSWPSPSVFDTKARRGCRDSVGILLDRSEGIRQGANAVQEARADIIEAGARDGTLRDVLRYAGIDRREEA